MVFEIKEIYPAVQAAYHALTPVYEPALLEAGEVSGLSPQEVSILFAVPTFEPEPTTVALLNVRSPYTSPDHYLRILNSLNEKGMLAKVGYSQFLITSLGSSTVKEILKAAYNAMASIQTLPVTALMDFASWLKEFADACFVASEPPGKWCVTHARRFHPGTGSQVMVRIDQFLTELCAYRDDAHLAAWQGYESNGHAWDILTLLWVENALSIESINQKLKRRGNTLAETQVAVDLLAKKGSVEIKNGQIEISPFGGDIRKIAEETTDRYYYAAWKNFAVTEFEEFYRLLKEFRKGLPTFQGYD